MRFPFSLLLVGAALAAGCGPSATAVIDRYRPDYAALKQKLARLAEKLPAERVTADQPPAVPLDLPLVLTTEKNAGNAEAVMVENLTSDDARPEFDLHLSRDLTAALYWTREGNRVDGGDPVFVEKALRSGLDLKYLIVHRVAELKLPEAVSDREYRPGQAVIEGFVFDLAKDEIVARYVCRAETAEKVEATVVEGEKDEEALVRFARSTLYENCRQQVRRKLEQVAGGKAEIE